MRSAARTLLPRRRDGRVGELQLRSELFDKRADALGRALAGGPGRTHPSIDPSVQRITLTGMGPVPCGSRAIVNVLVSMSRATVHLVTEPNDLLLESFRSGRDFGAWLGLVARQRSTENRPTLLGISKCGSSYWQTIARKGAPRFRVWGRSADGLSRCRPRMRYNAVVSLLNADARLRFE